MQGYAQKIRFLWLLKLLNTRIWSLRWPKEIKKVFESNFFLWTLTETEKKCKKDISIKMNTSLWPIYLRKREEQRWLGGWEEWPRHKPKGQAQIVFRRIPQQQRIEEHQLTRHCQIIWKKWRVKMAFNSQKKIVKFESITLCPYS